LTTSSVLQTSVGNNESGSITISPGSITPTGSGELFISGASNRGDCTSVVVPTSFADIYPNCATTFSSDMAYFVSSASGHVTPYWTFTGSGIAYSASVLASFCPAAGCNVAFQGNGGFPGFMRSGVDVPWDERFDPYSIWQFQGGHYAS
jgi:hypothetical protein